MSTIYDIAKAAKTSPASVSRVINGREGVKADTAKRIRQAIEAMDFQPRWKALGRDRFLIFVPEYKKVFNSGYVAGILSGIMDASFASGTGLQLRPFSFYEKDAQDFRQLYIQESVCGCILISMYQGYSLPGKLNMAGLPHVVVGHKMQDDGIHQVLLDDFEAGKDAAEFLLSLGHERIVMVSFSHRDHGHLERYNGFAQAVERVTKKSPQCLQCNDATYEAGKSAARQLLSPLERPSAVVITNEDIAAGFQAEAKEMGFNIPKDISVIAFEETDKLLLLDTPITTMQTPSYAMGIESVKMLRSMVSGNKSGSKSPEKYVTKRIGIPLVARHSTAALR